MPVHFSVLKAVCAVRVLVASLGTGARQQALRERPGSKHRSHRSYDAGVRKLFDAMITISQTHSKGAMGYHALEREGQGGAQVKRSQKLSRGLATWEIVPITIVLHALALAGQAPRKVGEAAAGTARLRGGVCTCT